MGKYREWRVHSGAHRRARAVGRDPDGRSQRLEDFRHHLEHTMWNFGDCARAHVIGRDRLGASTRARAQYQENSEKTGMRFRKIGRKHSGEFVRARTYGRVHSVAIQTGAVRDWSTP